MIQDVTIEIAPDQGAKVRLKLYGVGLAAGADIVKPLPKLGDYIDTLRRGDPPAAVVNAVAKRLKEWLMDDGVEPYLVPLLGNPQGKKLRVVFNIEQRLLPALADIPIELVEYHNAPLVLYPMVESLVHLLPSVGQPPAALYEWPLRIIIVRSNPDDLGGAVPPAAPLREKLLQLASALGAQAVQVDLLSREPEAIAPPTWDDFRKQIGPQAYHIMVFLGHGDVIITHEGLEPTGVLQFETPGGEAADPVASNQLRNRLQAIPVVLLAACLSSAELKDAEIKGLVNGKLPTWVRGSQGVAQALVNSQAGVQIAVGMRYRLEQQAAITFLEAFFTSLLQTRPGDVEAAIRAGRDQLYDDNPYPPSWSAPVVFRTLGSEPLFGFLARPPSFPPDPQDERDELYRRDIWNALVKLPLSSRTLAGALPFEDLLRLPEQGLRDRATARGPVLVVERSEGPPGSLVTLTIGLLGQLKVSSLEGRLALGANGGTIQAVRPVAALNAGSHRLLSDINGGECYFRFQVKSGSHAQQLVPGPLFEVTVAVSAEAAGVFYPVTVETTEVRPRSAVVQTLSNVILVPAP